jgi:hypothetical protein
MAGSGPSDGKGNRKAILGVRSNPGVANLLIGLRTTMQARAAMQKFVSRHFDNVPFSPR